MNDRLLVAPVVLVAAAVLSGCSTPDGGSAEQSRDRFYASLDSTQEALGGAWTVQDDTTPRGCDLPFWARGESYAALRLGSMPEDVSAAVSVARNALREQGFTTTIDEVGSVTELRARRTGTEIVTFRVTDDGMTLQGESDCRPR